MARCAYRHDNASRCCTRHHRNDLSRLGPRRSARRWGSPQIAADMLAAIRRVLPLPADDTLVARADGAIQAGAGALPLSVSFLGSPPSRLET
jgi:hypothetical protein